MITNKIIIKNYSLLLAIVCFFPSLLFVILGSSSLALGIIISCLIIIFYNQKIPIPSKILSYKISFIILFFLVNLFYAIAFTFSFKLIQSFIFFVVLLASASVLSDEVDLIANQEVFNITKFLAYIFLFIGFIGALFPFHSLGYQNFLKPVFPFSEPSHYVLCSAPFFLFLSVHFRKYKKIIFILILLLIGGLLPSLLMILLVILISGILYSSKLFRLIFLTILILISLFYFFRSVDLINYFIERVDFSGGASTSSNLSLLVYLQGWEDAYIGFTSTYGFGLGFQNMGIQPPGEYGELIYSIKHGYLNRKDGGFLAAKILGEFGVLGILLIIMYLNFCLKCVRRLVQYMNGQSNIDFKIVFSYCIVITFSLELFIRGYGYFSPGVLFFSMAIFTLFKYDLQKNKLDEK